MKLAQVSFYPGPKRETAPTHLPEGSLRLPPPSLPPVSSCPCLPCLIGLTVSQMLCMETKTAPSQAW